MKENKLTAISIFTISLAIVFACILYLDLGNGRKEQDAFFPINHSEIYDKGLMTEDEAAKYLSLTQDQFNKLVISQEAERKGLSSYETYRFIPYISINDSKFYNKEQLDKWIEYNSTNRTDIKTGV